MAFEPFTKDEHPTMENFNEKLQEVWNGSARIETGEYEGTGTTGKDNKNSITFEFIPKLVIISPEYPDTSGVCAVWANGQTKGTVATGTSTSTNYTNTLDWDGNTLYWWLTSATQNAYCQLNVGGKRYYYVAIG